jgi:hypothetical protein
MSETTATVNLSEQVRKILADATAPLALTDIKKQLKEAGVPMTGKKKVTDDEIQQVLTSPGCHVHPPTTAKGKPKYWHRPPLSVTERVGETVRTKVAALGQEPVKASGTTLGKPGAKEGAEAQKAFETTLQQLIAEGVLFVHPGGKYGKSPPPKPRWHEAAPHKTEFGKIVTAARKVLSRGDVSAEELFAELRAQLGLEKPTTPPPPTPAVVTPAPTPVTPPAPGPAPLADLRTVLKEAYDHLCKFPEFRDKLVELPSLYHETTERMPGLTPEVFQNELWQMSREYLIELHVLNEVYLAKEPHLAIQRNDRLYYYARWK